MNTSVSFTIAKLLKEKGFNGVTISAYHKNSGKLVFTDWNNVESNDDILIPEDFNLKEDSWLISAPTIADVVMWLYDKYDIWVAINPFYTMEGKRFSSDVWKNNYKISVNHFKTPTDAYEAAIEYSLVNLVK